MVLKKSGPRYLLEMAKMKILRRLVASDNDSAVTPEALAKQHDVPIHRSANINDELSLQWLRALEPDLIISTNFSHYIAKKARDVAATGAWNLHKSYLPHNRGMAPSFYALLNDNPYAGATLHVLEKGFDTGAIIDQRKVDISHGDTVYDLNQRSSRVGGEMLAELLDKHPLDQIEATEQPSGEWPDHTYPSPADIRRFLKAGHSFDKWSFGDLRGLIG
jgi:methionyl-tRNA formyltransferase